MTLTLACWPVYRLVFWLACLLGGLLLFADLFAGLLAWRLVTLSESIKKTLGISATLTLACLLAEMLAGRLVTLSKTIH